MEKFSEYTPSFAHSTNYDYNYQFGYACQTGNVDNILYLITNNHQKIDFEYEENYPIRAACEFGHVNVVKFLTLKYDVDLTARDNYAIKYASQNGHLDVVKFLLEEYSHIIDPTADNNYAIRHATHNKHFEIASLLSENLNVCDTWDFKIEELDEVKHKKNCCSSCILL